MKCDLAFDLMTDPAGCASQALQSHLARCRRCRQMQETLAPALEWLSESSHDDDSEPLPPSLAGFRTSGVRAPAFAAKEALEVARESAASLSKRTASTPVRYVPVIGTLVRSAALIALGAFAAFVFVPATRTAIPNADDRDCLRHEAAAATNRSPAEAELLLTTCAKCHEPNGRLRPRDRHAGAVNLETSWRYADSVDEFQRLWSSVVSDKVFAEGEQIAVVASEHNRMLCSNERLSAFPCRLSV
jgi:hypothetical protein